MRMHHNGFFISPIVTKINGKFNSNVAIRHSNGEQQIHESIGRFASRDAATLFAVNWALANIKRSQNSGLYKN